MAKVPLRYTAKRLPLSLRMPWLVEPLTWDNDTGRTIDVDSGDAERLTTDGDGTTFVIEPLRKEGVITKEEIAEGLTEGPLGVMKFLTALPGAPPDIGEDNAPFDVEEVEETSTTDMQCPYCKHKPYKRQDFYDRHIASKHPEYLVEANDGNDNW